ncbi:MAG: amidase [Alphaproteobacteria bacterium]|nr:MAG: amidase [Alphaproteobacteria bacterium]
MSSNYVKNPGNLQNLFNQIKDKKLSPVELINSYVNRINDTQKVIEQWKSYDFEKAIETAKLREQQVIDNNILGPLHGIPVGIKDIIHAEGFKTEFNCKAFKDTEVSKLDSGVVLALRSAGAIILGKTHTTEFAFYDPSPARNPHNPNHTPGGSSSGSGSSVASGTVPMSVGTQTMASVNRPAIYCGISAFKPTNGSITTYGISPLAPSFDTPGFYGWSIADACYGYNIVSLNDKLPLKSLNKQDVNIVSIIDDLTSDINPNVSKQIEETKSMLKELGFNVEEKASPVKFNDLLDLHWEMLIYETGKNLQFLLNHPNELIGPRLLQIIKDGLNINIEKYTETKSKLNRSINKFFSSFNKNTIFIFPAIPNSAPVGLESTGEPKYIAPWTALSGPIVSCSTGLDDSKMPVGILLCAHPFKDRYLSNFCMDIYMKSEYFTGLKL